MINVMSKLFTCVMASDIRTKYCTNENGKNNCIYFRERVKKCPFGNISLSSTLPPRYSPIQRNVPDTAVLSLRESIEIKQLIGTNLRRKSMKKMRLFSRKLCI